MRKSPAALVAALLVGLLATPTAHAAGPAPHYVMTAFTNSSESNMHVYDRNVTASLNGSTGSTWAPEWFRDSDGSVHVVSSASTTGTAGQFRPYRITATDRADATFTIGPGLANADGSSFQAVNFPGRYLRHHGYEVRLDLRSGDAAFAGDASFTVTAPLG
ncbi:AbfB domain-containing protein [Saccharothrix xinjiangensis]|uniref:AbfB domain-containing protein n=1 Tax=Saccharothrix xinjiangensis TaxID=204798 RepID=A0ABV9XUS7_9PSEU